MYIKLDDYEVKKAIVEYVKKKMKTELATNWDEVFFEYKTRKRLKNGKAGKWGPTVSMHHLEHKDMELECFYFVDPVDLGEEDE